MNIKSIFSTEKPLQTKKIFASTEGVIAIQILANHQLKEHITTIPALLICVMGEVIFENENGISETLLAGDFINIEPHVKHWVNATNDSNLLLIK